MCKEGRGRWSGGVEGRGGQGQAGPRWAAGEERVAAELAQDGHVDAASPQGLNSTKMCAIRCCCLTNFLWEKLVYF